MSLCKRIAAALLGLGLALAPQLGAQDQSKSQTSPAPLATPAPPAAKPADVASPDAILAAAYEVISGPAGQARDWDRFRSLCLPGARLIPTGPKKDGGGFFARLAIFAFGACRVILQDADSVPDISLFY